MLINDSPPRALLIPIDADGGPEGLYGSQNLILDDLRVFPSADNPQVTIFQDADGGFLLERADGNSLELTANQRVDIANQTYRVHLPGPADDMPTTSSSTATDSYVRTMRLTLHVAPDEETAAAFIDAGIVQAELTPRVHLYLLVHLARLRIEDTRVGGAQVGHRNRQTDLDGTGWADVGVLCDDLQMSREQLSLQVFRIRDDMRKLGLPDAGEIIDRRRRGWIRIGVSASQLRLGRMF